MNVYTQMQAVQKDLAGIGISKADYNKHGEYYFRGIDAVMNVLGPILAKNELMIVPGVVESTVTRAQTSQGKPTNHWYAKVRYTFFASGAEKPENGYVTEFHGEAYDSSDKGLGKAITSAYKSMLFEVFCIPVEGQDDADSENIEVEDHPISQEQADKILALCEESGTDLHIFTQWLGVPEGGVMPASLYERAVSALQQKLAKLQGEKTGKKTTKGKEKDHEDQANS